MDTIKFAIRSRYYDSVLYEADIPADTPSGLKTRVALEKATAARANLDGANLAGAYLDGANLDGANLAGAYLQDKSKLVGERPIIQIGPIGSRCAYFVAYLTDQGLRLRAGCFFGTRAEFEAKLSDTHKDSQHAKEYRAALALIDAHAEIWTPAVTEKAEETEAEAA